MSRLRVLHLVGSATNDFFTDLSLLYARQCIEATANCDRYEFLIAYITPDRRWRFPASLHPNDLSEAKAVSLPAAVQFLSQQSIDVALPQMFCMPGMTQYRELLNLLEIPYVGNLPEQMAIAADKTKTKAIVSTAGVKVPKGELLRKGEIPTIEPPAIVKPNSADNSFGVTLVRAAKDFPAALEAAFLYSSEVVVEQFIEVGREVRCGVVEKKGALVCLPLQEYALDRKTKPIRTYHDKLIRDEKDDLELTSKASNLAWMIFPGDPDIGQVWSAAKQCYRAIGCRHYGLFDFRIDAEGQAWFIEAGLYCSFAPKSVLSLMQAANNTSLETFLQQAIETCLDPSSVIGQIVEPSPLAYASALESIPKVDSARRLYARH